MVRTWIAMAGILLSVTTGGTAVAACPGPDWVQVGYTDGEQGRPMHWMGRYVRQCATAGRSFARDAYLSGRQRGLQSFCQPARGYLAGTHGDHYLGACPDDLEPAFLDAYRAGARIHSVRRLMGQIDRQIEWYADQLQSPAIGEDRRREFAAELERLTQRRRDFEQRIDRYAERFAAVDRSGG